MKLVFIHGAPAVGKLSVARELAGITGYRLFHNHLTVDLLTAVFPFASEPFVRLREELWLAVFREAAQHDVSLIFTFNPERTVRERFIDDTAKVVEAAGGQVHFVELTCSQSELERRIETPARKEFGKLCSIEQYRALSDAGAFHFRRLPDGVSLDTTNTPAVDTAKLIHAFIMRNV
jgi:chloramphenicol 3-O-phosphotransferase